VGIGRRGRRVGRRGRRGRMVDIWQPVFFDKHFFDEFS
jgi:hypothetical protein